MTSTQGEMVISGAEAFALGDGPVGALLVHGYTGSPQGLRGLGEHLAAQGVAVSAPRLPGHGTTPADLNTRRHHEWVEQVEQAHAELAEGRDEIFIVALSFGAALSLDFVARRPGAVKGIVTIAGFVQTWDRRRHFAPVLRYLLRSVPGVANDIADPEMREIAYDVLPTASTYSMLHMINRARAALPLVTCPILIVHSHNDHTVDPRNAQVIYDNVASEDKAIEWFDRGYHVLTLDLEREQIFERALRFIKEHSDRAL